MKHYVGLDVSMKETAICVVNEEGEIVWESTEASDPGCIAERVAQLGLNVTKVGLESGSISHFLTRELRQMGLPTICIDARKMATILSVNVNKTDRNDAVGIAQAMRAGLYREVHQRSEWSVQVSSLLGARRALVGQRTHTINTVRGLLKAHGIRLGAVGRVQFSERVRLVTEGLEAPARVGFESLLVVHDLLCVELKKLEDQIRREARSRKEAALLMTVPGIGLITALTYLVEIDDPYRFSDSRTVGAYLGLTPRQYSSGETVRQGRISKCGSPDLRYLLYECGIVLLTRTKSWSSLKAWGMKIQRKSGLQKAAVAVGRKLAVVMHRMLLTGEEFRYGSQKKVA